MSCGRPQDPPRIYGSDSNLHLIGFRFHVSEGSTEKGELLFDFGFFFDQDVTLMHMTAALNISGMMARVPGKLLFGAFTKAIEKDRAGLKDVVEKGAK
jgi:hypothetical protein